MTCESCGTELPQGAMFCGECGRAVGQRATGSFAREASGSGSRWGRDTRVIDRAELREPGDDFSHWAPAPVVPAEADEQPGVVRSVEPGFEPAAEDAAEPPLLSAFDLEAQLEPELEHDLPPVSVVAETAASLDTPEQGPVLDELSHYELSHDEPDDDGIDDPAGIEPGHDEFGQTLIVPRREQGERFILQFSTGESVTVFGTGLLGRNPIPQPGEYFDQLVTISDPGKSVSKTHLEFGQESGSFWVSDRFSGNGSIAREPEAAPKRLQSGRRYRIVRGSRIDIGEQFFIIS